MYAHPIRRSAHRLGSDLFRSFSDGEQSVHHHGHSTNRVDKDEDNDAIDDEMESLGRMLLLRSQRLSK